MNNPQSHLPTQAVIAHLRRAALVLGLLIAAAVNAEPQLQLPTQQPALRATPAPFTVPDYQGSLAQGYRMIYFIAPGGELRWNAWTDPSYIAIAREAMRLVEQRAIANPACNRFFAERMPGGKTFTQLWHADGPNRIRISFSPGPSGTWRAATYRDSAPFDWTISETAVRLGPESVASAMVHEATRSNGIGPEVAIAYGAERVCGMAHFLLTERLIRQLGWKILPKRPAS